ncbi:MAG: CRISPR-associated endonuclease Cas2 [candidate division WOR-3 bacterium]
MYVIMVYDVEVPRLNKVLKVSRRYLNWVQNSVFEGELTMAQLTELKNRLRKILNPNVDSVIFYKLRTTTYMDREILGIEKAQFNQII